MSICYLALIGLGLGLDIDYSWIGVGGYYLSSLSFFSLFHRTDEFRLETQPTDCKDAFRKFSQYLGRVTSYRALSLTPEQFEVIKQKNTIWPTGIKISIVIPCFRSFLLGRLSQSEEAVNNIVEKYGVWHVAYARLYIGIFSILIFLPSVNCSRTPFSGV